MMKLARYPLMAAAALLVATPALATPASPAASLSIAKSVRAGTETSKKSKLAGSGLIVAAIAAVAVAAGAVIIADSDHSDSK